MLAAAALTLTLGSASATASGTADPREGLGAGLFDAEIATTGIDLLSTQPKPAGSTTPTATSPSPATTPTAATTTA